MEVALGVPAVVHGAPAVQVAIGEVTTTITMDLVINSNKKKTVKDK